MYEAFSSFSIQTTRDHAHMSTSTSLTVCTSSEYD